MEDKKISVYYDGSCRVCNAFAGTVESSDQAATFATKDVSKGVLPKGATREQVWRDMYVVESDGTTHKGFDGWLRVLEEYPRWRSIAQIGRLPLVYQCARIGYRLFADNRHRIPGMTIRS